MSTAAHVTRIAVATATMTALLGGTGLAATAGAAPPGVTSVLSVTVGATTITGVPARTPAGQYTFKVHEAAGGTLQLARLREGYTAAQLDRDIMAGFGGNDAGAVARIYRQVVFEGGTGGAPYQQFTTYLVAGRYVYFNSNSLDPVRTFTVGTAGATPPAPPSVGVTITGFEDAADPGRFGFEVSGTLAVRGQLRFKAAGGDEPHFLAVFKLAAGKSGMDCLAFQGPPGPQAPCQEVFSTGIVSPGQAMVLPYRLDGPGRYLLACFLPDPEQGMDHASLGMMKVVQVRT